MAGRRVLRRRQVGSRDREGNGLALCVLHPKTFDLGAFTLSPEGVLLVPDLAHGTAGFEEALLRHHGQRVRPPQRPELRPEAAFLDWHGREVFKGVARHLGIAARQSRASPREQVGDRPHTRWPALGPTGSPAPGSPSAGKGISSGSMYYRKGAFRDILGHFGRTLESAKTLVF